MKCTVLILAWQARKENPDLYPSPLFAKRSRLGIITASLILLIPVALYFVDQPHETPKASDSTSTSSTGMDGLEIDDAPPVDDDVAPVDSMIDCCDVGKLLASGRDLSHLARDHMYCVLKSETSTA